MVARTIFQNLFCGNNDLYHRIRNQIPLEFWKFGVVQETKSLEDELVKKLFCNPFMLVREFFSEGRHLPRKGIY